MKQSVKISMVQYASVWLDSAANADRMAQFIETEAREHGAELVIFPELSNTGYVEPHGNTDFVRSLYEQCEPLDGPLMQCLQRAAASAGTYVIAGVAREDETIPAVLYNSAVLIGPRGELIGVQDKLHACLDEKSYFSVGAEVSVFDTELGKIGIQICYDVRFPEVARVQALKGAEMVVSVWASAVQPGKVPESSIRDRCATRSMENGLYFLGCNRSGREGSREFYGRSAISDPSGSTVAVSDGAEEHVIRAELRGNAVVEQRAYLTIFRDRRPELYQLICER